MTSDPLKFIKQGAQIESDEDQGDKTPVQDARSSLVNVNRLYNEMDKENETSMSSYSQKYSDKLIEKKSAKKKKEKKEKKDKKSHHHHHSKSRSKSKKKHKKEKKDKKDK